MSNDLWFQIPIAIVMGYMLLRLIPVAKNWMENGPRGSSKEWLNASMLLAGVVLFVAFLVATVRG
ncbi:MAG: hypothetical protein KTR32_03840 [Granulosicoccus sp.]|nr:hypothetical protein [Granulosicoccus sp.]